MWRVGRRKRGGRPRRPTHPSMTCRSSTGPCAEAARADDVDAAAALAGGGGGGASGPSGTSSALDLAASRSARFFSASITAFFIAEDSNVWRRRRGRGGERSVRKRTGGERWESVPPLI